MARYRKLAWVNASVKIIERNCRNASMSPGLFLRALRTMRTIDVSICFFGLTEPSGFEEFLRDPEDLGEWTPVQYFSGSKYLSREDALAAAKLAVWWL